MTRPRTVELRGAGGLRLAAEAWGDPAHPPILLSHGGGQTRHSWQGTARSLAARGWYVINYDHRGHGESDWSPDGQYNLAIHAADQRAIARSLDSPPVVVGASLGGLSALLAQGECDARIYRAIVLVDITPHMNQEGAREASRVLAVWVDPCRAKIDTGKRFDHSPHIWYHKANIRKALRLWADAAHPLGPRL